MNQPQEKFYSDAEEKLNILTHVFGLALSIVGVMFLILKTISNQDSQYLLSAIVFGFSLILLYVASTLYHMEKKPERRARLRVFDHVSIYILIAGTYTPFSLITLKGNIGWIIFGVVWSLAIAGTMLKLFFTGRFDILSTLIYVGMGWVIIFAINPLIDNLSYNGLFTLFLGGGFYTLGAILYSIKKLKFNHAIFHVFVLLGSFSHYYSIYFFVL